MYPWFFPAGLNALQRFSAGFLPTMFVAVLFAVQLMAEAAGPVVVEGEALLGTAQTTDGQVLRQEMAGFGSGWGGNAQMFWAVGQPGAQLLLSPDLPATGLYEVRVFLTVAPDFGIVEINLGGQGGVSFDGYNSSVALSEVMLGQVQLTAGSQQLKFRVTGKNGMSAGYLLGIDRIEFYPSGAEPPLPPTRKASAETPAVSPATSSPLSAPESSPPPPPPAPSSPADIPQPWTTQDVIDPRIDVSAQYGLMRMFKKDPVAAAAASAMLSAVKNGKLAGIYQPDQQVPALRAQSVGKGWWQLLPGGAIAVCVTFPEGKPPLIVFSKEARSQSYLLDPALQSAWSACGIEWSEPRPYLATLPPKQPATAPPSGQPTQLTVLVLDPTHNPVPGATVSIGAGVPTGGGVTNSAGLVTVNGGPGVYHVEVDAPAKLGGHRYYISARVEEGRTNFYQVTVGKHITQTSIQHSAGSGAGSGDHKVVEDEIVHGDTISVPPGCIKYAADCITGCTQEAIAEGENCNADPSCLYLGSSRYDRCVKRCGIATLVCPP